MEICKVSTRRAGHDELVTDVGSFACILLKMDTGETLTITPISCDRLCISSALSGSSGLIVIPVADQEINLAFVDLNELKEGD